MTTGIPTRVEDATPEPPEMAQGLPPAVRSSEANWSKPVDRLPLPADATGALNLNVEGRRLVGPMQGFGPLLQKRYRIALDAPELDPRTVVATWKAEFGSFWPKGSRFYGPITGIAPGEVALLNIDAGAHQTLSTGVLVLFADEESFAFMTPEGHMFAAWITFSAFREEGATVAHVEVLLRANDPFYDVMMTLGFSRKEDEFWVATLRNIGIRFGLDAEATMTQTCIDPRRQWRKAGNVRHNAALRSGFYTMTHPWIMFRRTG